MMELKPASVFEAFSEINRVPRPSKREDKMMEYLLEVGRSLGLETQRDEIGNVVIRKPALRHRANCRMRHRTAHCIHATAPQPERPQVNTPSPTTL